MSNSAVYSLHFANERVERKYRELLDLIHKREQERFETAEKQLRANPYPNASVPAGVIRKVGSDWRYKVSYSYRIIYRIDGHRVIILNADHRKDVYRNLG